MIIVIDGPDNTGKTTLARRFEELGFIYAHHGPPPPEQDVFAYYASLIASAALKGDDVVFDRLWPGEVAYGTHVRGRSRISRPQFQALNTLFYELGGASVICLTDTEAIIEKWRSRLEDEYVKDEQAMLRIIGAYCDMEQDMFWSVDGRGHHMVYNYKLHDGAHGLARFTDEFMKRTGRQ